MFDDENDGGFQVTLSLPNFGASFAFEWSELRCLLAARRNDDEGQLFTSKTLDQDLLAAVRDYIGRAAKVHTRGDGGGEGSDGAVTVFLYLLLAMSGDRPPSRRTR